VEGVLAEALATAFLGAALLAGGVVAFWAEQSIMLLASNPARSIGFGQNIE